jgi:polysaccharide export outer membrane protein
MVGKPGRYPLEATGTRMTDVLAQAGGISPAGSDVVIITGQRDGKPFRREVNVGQLFTQGASEDPALQNEDVLFIDRMPVVYIYGEVQRPGTIRLERGMSVMQALATGGGLTARGTEKGLRVHRRGPDGKVTVIQPGMDDAVQPGDVIYVRESIF